MICRLRSSDKTLVAKTVAPLVASCSRLGRRQCAPVSVGQREDDRIAESTKAIPFTLDLTRGYFPYIGAQAIMDAGMPDDPTNEFSQLDTLIPRVSNPDVRRRFDECAAGPFEFEGTMLSPNGLRTEMRWTGTCEVTPDAKFMRGLMQNVTDLRRLERDLAMAIRGVSALVETATAIALAASWKPLV